MTGSTSDVQLRLAIVVTAQVTASSFVSSFARYIAGKGHEVTIIADGLEQSSEQIGEGRLSQVSVPMSRDPHPWKDLYSSVKLTRQLKKIKPDVLTYATPKASLLGSIAGFVLRVPVRVYQLWGLRLETTGGLNRLILSQCERITSFLSTNVLANSGSLADRFEELNLSAGQSVDLLGEGSSHGVDIQHYSSISAIPTLDEKVALHLQKGHTDLIVGFIGRLHPDKGIDTLLAATKLVHRDGISIKLVIVGNDEGADLNLTGGLSEITVFAGQVHDTRPYYAAMDVLVLPSLREGFPNVVLEAAAMSVPAIVSDGTGVVDSVIDGVTGFVVPVGDAASLAEKIRCLAGSHELKKEMGQAARHRVEESYVQEQVWDRTLAYLTQQAKR